MEMVNRLNGRSKPKTRRKPAKKRTCFKTGITIALGIAIPAMSLTLSHIAGTLASENSYALAIFSALCGISVLIVSLSHLAQAIRDITRAYPWQAWMLAITLDLSIVNCELIGVWSSTTLWTIGLMFVVGLFSMALNCYAFLNTK